MLIIPYRIQYWCPISFLLLNKALFRWVFGAGFGGFPNPPPLSISISRCDNYSYFPYHYLKNYKFKYSFFGGLQIHRTSAATEHNKAPACFCTDWSDRWFRRTSAATDKNEVQGDGYYWPLAVAGCPFMSVDVASCFFHVDYFWVISYAKVNKTKE